MAVNGTLLNTMSKIERIVHTIGIEELFLQQNLDYYYDHSLAVQSSPQSNLELRGQIPFCPVVPTKIDAKGAPTETYVPIGDHQAKSHSLYMGMLVAKSVLVPNLYVVEHLPHPPTTTYPTRIMTLLGGRDVFLPICGFLLYDPKILPLTDIALLTKAPSNEIGVSYILPFHGKRTAAKSVLLAVKSAQRRADRRLAKTITPILAV